MNKIENQNTDAGHRLRNRRRKYIINPAFQWKYAGAITLSVFAVSALISTVLYGVLHHQARLRFMHPETYQGEVSQVILFSALALAALTAAGVGVWWIVLTHRFCGPLTVMGRWLAELGSGRFPHLRPLRQKDEFREFYAILAKTVDSLKTTKQEELAAFTEALEAVRVASDGDEQVLRGAMGALATRLQTWRRDAADTLGVPVEEVLSKPEKRTGPKPIATEQYPKIHV